MGSSKKREETSLFITELDKFKDILETKYFESIQTHIAELVTNLENIDRKIEILNEEIDELRMNAHRAKEDKNYSLYNKINSTIAARIDLLKKLYESRADLEGILQKYYDTMLSSEFKYYDQKLKAIKELNKGDDDNNVAEIVKNFIISISGANQNKTGKKNLSTQSKKNKKNDLELIMEEIDLPEEFKEL